MFRGRFMHTIDAKGRTSIPVPFRQELERRSERPPILTNAVTNAAGCLHLYPYEDWIAFEQKIASVSAVDPDVQSFARMMISGATECPIDKQGRILVPPHLRAHAKLEREITIAGVWSRIEIWDRARFDADIANTQARYHEISSAVAKMGT